MSDIRNDEAESAHARSLAEAELNRIDAPRRLGIQPYSLPGTVAFLAQIFEQTCIRRVSTLVDLRSCQHITPEGCLLLTAEIERCLRRFRTPIWVRYPHDIVAGNLSEFGFFSHLRMDEPVRMKLPRAKKAQKDFILVRSGTNDDIASKLNGIAAVTDALYGNPAYAEAVEIALQEAMTNVRSHAFDGREPSKVAEMPGRWWFAGRVDHSRQEAVFYALDHGVGIPVRAPQTMGEAIITYWSLQRTTPVKMRDRHVLEAAVNARRKEGIESRTNNGLPAMIGLVETESDAGSVQIRSGRAGYEFSKKGAQNGHPVVVERCYGFQRPFPGTLVVWRVAGPAKAQLEAK